jgi:hypothetical protein
VADVTRGPRGDADVRRDGDVAEKPSRLGRAGAVLSILAAIAVVYSGPAARPKSALALEEASGTVTVWVGSWWQSQIPLVMQTWTRDNSKQ